MKRAEEPEWSPKGRAKLSLSFQSFCLSVALLLVLHLICLFVSVSTCLSLLFLPRSVYQSSWSNLLNHPERPSELLIAHSNKVSYLLVVNVTL